MKYSGFLSLPMSWKYAQTRVRRPSAPIDVRRGFGQVGHHQAVVVGAGRFNRHPPEQRMIQVAHFDPGTRRRDAEGGFEHGSRPLTTMAVARLKPT